VEIHVKNPVIPPPKHDEIKKTRQYFTSESRGAPRSSACIRLPSATLAEFHFGYYRDANEFVRVSPKRLLKRFSKSVENWWNALNLVRCAAGRRLTWSTSSCGRRRNCSTQAASVSCLRKELGGTAMFGKQRAEANPERTVEAMYAIWHGNGPGVDRAGDALKHGNAYVSSSVVNPTKRRRHNIRLRKHRFSILSHCRLPRYVAMSSHDLNVPPATLYRIFRRESRRAGALDNTPHDVNTKIRQICAITPQSKTLGCVERPPGNTCLVQSPYQRHVHESHSSKLGGSVPSPLSRTIARFRVREA